VCTGILEIFEFKNLGIIGIDQNTMKNSRIIGILEHSKFNIEFHK